VVLVAAALLTAAVVAAVLFHQVLADHLVVGEDRLDRNQASININSF